MKAAVCAALVVIGTSTLVTGDAFAQCAFDGPYRAKGFRTSLVRKFYGCPSTSFPIPNSQTGTGVPTCSPPSSEESVYDFSDGSYCYFTLLAKHEDPCSTGLSRPCTGVTGRLICTDITQPGGNGTIPAHDDGWVLGMVVRATVDDFDNGDMTVIDFPVRISLPRPHGGTLEDDFRFGSNLLDMSTFLPGCAQIEIVHLTLWDPDGVAFATRGAGTRPRGF